MDETDGTGTTVTPPPSIINYPNLQIQLTESDTPDSTSTEIINIPLTDDPAIGCDSGGDHEAEDVATEVVDDSVRIYNGPRFLSGAPRQRVGLAATRFDVAETVKSLKRDKEMQARYVAAYIMDYEVHALKSLFILGGDGSVYYYDRKKRTMFEFTFRNEAVRAHLFLRYGLLGRSALTENVVDILRSFAHNFGKQFEIRTWACYRKEDSALYINRYNGTSWCLDGRTQIRVVANGDKTVFIPDGGKPCLKPVIGRAGAIRRWLVDDIQFVPETCSGMTAQQQKVAFMIWIFALAFPDLMPTKPLLLVEGAPGSGKTFAVQRVMAALHGACSPRNIGRRDEDDFGVSLLGQPICLLDNVDNFVEWLQDLLCSFTTSGGWKRRKLYTDTTTYDVQPQTFIALATKNPTTFKRSDVADRCIILRLDRREGRGLFTPSSQLLEDTLRNRDEIVGEWLYYLNQIVARIARGDLRIPRKRSYRMADFACFAYLVGDVLGLNEEEIDGTLAALQAEREVFMSEGDPFVDLVRKWLEKSANNGRVVALGDLHSELMELAKGAGRKVSQNPMVLAQRIRDGAFERHFRVQVSGSVHAQTFQFSRLSPGDTIIRLV